MLVTGATGTVGRSLVGLLRAAGAAVRPASRHPPDPDTVAFDFRDRSTWRTAFDGVEAMFLLRPPDLTRVSRDLAPPLAFAQVLGLRHVVLLSVQGAGKVPVLPHAAAERWLRRSGLSWTFVRPSYFDQNLSGSSSRTSGTALTYDEVAVVLSAELGRRIRYRRPGLLTYARHARGVLGLPPAMVAVTAALHATARLGLAGSRRRMWRR